MQHLGHPHPVAFPVVVTPLSHSGKIEGCEGLDNPSIYQQAGPGVWSHVFGICSGSMCSAGPQHFSTWGVSRISGFLRSDASLCQHGRPRPNSAFLSMEPRPQGPAPVRGKVIQCQPSGPVEVGIGREGVGKGREKVG
jgi:hypothetical protein